MSSVGLGVDVPLFIIFHSSPPRVKFVLPARWRHKTAPRAVECSVMQSAIVSFTLSRF